MFLITYNGKIQTVNEWAHELGIDSKLIYKRIGQGIVDPAEIFKAVRHHRHKIKHMSDLPTQHNRLEADRNAILLVARSGGRRPNRRSRDPVERRLAWTVCRHQKRKDAAYEELRLIRPDWFGDARIGLVAGTKKRLLEMAKTGLLRPNRESLDKEERQLASALRRYTRKGGESYDRDFDNTIRRLRPDWFGRGHQAKHHHQSYKQKYACNGEALSVSGWSKKLHYTPSGIRWRLRHFPIEIALSPGRLKGEHRALRTYTYQGESLTTRQLAIKLGYHPSHMRYRLNVMPIEQALVPKSGGPHWTELNQEVDRLLSELDAPDPQQVTEVSIEPIAAVEPASVSSVKPVILGKRKKTNPIRVSSVAVAKMRECIGRKDAIYGDNRAIAERLRRYLLRSIEVEMPRCLMTADTSPTARYFRHNNWILTIDGGLHIRMITFGGAKQWRVKDRVR